jgi:hypothetical protein
VIAHHRPAQRKQERLPPVQPAPLAAASTSNDTPEVVEIMLARRCCFARRGEAAHPSRLAASKSSRSAASMGVVTL